jgi:hypothetical protein
VGTEAAGPHFMAAAIIVTFSRGVGPNVQKGPFSQLRLEGEVMRFAVGGPIIAKHENQKWKVDGFDYRRADCDNCAVALHFERIDGTQSKTYGPFNCFSLVDGVAFADHEVFAFADRAIVDWYCHPDGRHWPLFIIEPAT